MSAEQIHFEIEGIRPLLMHSSRLVDPLDDITIDLKRLTAKRDKTAADHEEIARTEWFGGLWLNEGQPCIPAEAIESAFIAAAKSKRKGKAGKAGFLCADPAMLHYDGSRDVEELWTDRRFRFRYPVNMAGSRTMRTRARFPTWRATVIAEFLPTVLNRRDVIEILEIAGSREGLGDWRPKFGRFTVKVLD
jgi:hypothetical protein